MEQGPIDRRRHPRVPYDGSTALRVTAVRDFPVVDVSPGGIFFQSDQYLDPGSLLSIGDKLMSFDARVMSCTLVEAHPTLLEYHYLVRCRFEPEIDAERFELFLNVANTRPRGS